MFDSYIIKDKSLEAARRITTEMTRDRESREKIAEKEIKARDRVDISLEEYENMKKEISELRSSNQFYETVFDRIEIPWDKQIVPDSIHTEWCDHPMDFRRTFKVTFDVSTDKFGR